MTLTPPRLVRAEGSLVHDGTGAHWVDLGITFGAVFLGHSHPAVVSALQTQAGKLVACGRSGSEWDDALAQSLASLLPPHMSAGPLLSTGMEAAEFALRIAAAQTRRDEFAGFACSMHGKSTATAAICWENAPVRSSGMHLLPYLDSLDEDGIVRELRKCLSGGRIAALFIEPIQGSHGGSEASPAFYAEAIALCRAYGTLCVYDEILTGLWRTGARFHCESLPYPPDLLLFAKNMGNGFPVSSVALGPGVAILPRALPGSTFANNPLAKAVTVATLRAMAALPMAAKVARLGEIARERFASLKSQQGVEVRGRGALWCLDLGDDACAARAVARLQQQGILATTAGGVLRLLPCATLADSVWDASCSAVVRACEDVLRP